MKGMLVLVSIFLSGVWEVCGGWTLTEGESLAAPRGISFTRRIARDDANRAVELHIIGFNANQHTCVVMDNPAGELTLATAAKKRGVLAAVNGGYFHPDRTPLGLVIRDGKTLHPFERAKLLSGLVVVTNGRVTLQRACDFKQKAAVRDALQAGPFLVDKGRSVAGLNATRFAARTVVLQLEGDGRGLLSADSITLAGLGDLLATQGVMSDGPVVRALNLDGGSSTGLWVKSEPEFYRRELKDVRNYLGLLPRSPTHR
jgi:hypothetical protein